MTMQERTAILFQILSMGEQAFDLMVQSFQDETDFPCYISATVEVDGQPRQMTMEIQIH